MSGTRPGSSSAMTSTAALASNAVTLTSGDLERIKRLTKGEFNLNQKTLEQEADEARAALRKQASLERTKAFPNTLAAMRKRKEAAKDERLRAEEEARVKLDKEEEAIRLQERLRILENAHRQLTENTDKMKMLRSMKLASNIHDVRQRQIALAERKRDMEKEADEEAFQRMLLKIKAGDEREKAEAEARAAQRKAVAVGQKIQLAEFLDRKMREMEEYREEGRKIAAATKQRAIEEEEDKERKKLMVIQQNLEMKEANAAIMRAKVEAQKEAEREAERLAAYVAAKQKDAEVKAGIIRAKQEEAWRKARMIAEKVSRIRRSVGQWVLLVSCCFSWSSVSPRLFSQLRSVPFPFPLLVPCRMSASLRPECTARRSASPLPSPRLRPRPTLWRSTAAPCSVRCETTSKRTDSRSRRGWMQRPPTRGDGSRRRRSVLRATCARWTRWRTATSTSGGCVRSS